VFGSICARLQLAVNYVGAMNAHGKQPLPMKAAIHFIFLAVEKERAPAAGALRDEDIGRRSVVVLHLRAHVELRAPGFILPGMPFAFSAHVSPVELRCAALGGAPVPAPLSSENDAGAVRGRRGWRLQRGYGFAGGDVPACGLGALR